jgi:hypothetical protein
MSASIRSKLFARLLQADAMELRLRIPNKVLLSLSMALQTPTPRTLSYAPAAWHYFCA